MQWENIKEIIETLNLEYGDDEIDVDNITISELHDLIIGLQDFSDDPDGVDDRQLTVILEAWIDSRK
jgi:FeS assembly protein IscX